MHLSAILFRTVESSVAFLCGEGLVWRDSRQYKVGRASSHLTCLQQNIKISKYQYQYHQYYRCILVAIPPPPRNLFEKLQCILQMTLKARKILTSAHNTWADCQNNTWADFQNCDNFFFFQNCALHWLHVWSWKWKLGKYMSWAERATSRLERTRVRNLLPVKFARFYFELDRPQP